MQSIQLLEKWNMTMVLRNNCWLLVVSYWLLVSCSSNEIKNKDLKVFRYNEHANITTLDPAFAKDLRTIWVTNQLFNGLVQLDEKLEVQPDIAKSWTVSNEVKTYEFHL